MKKEKEKTLNKVKKDKCKIQCRVNKKKMKKIYLKGDEIIYAT